MPVSIHLIEKYYYVTSEQGVIADFDNLLDAMIFVAEGDFIYLGLREST